jgi:polyisoprenoid-binding protein YceI
MIRTSLRFVAASTLAAALLASGASLAQAAPTTWKIDSGHSSVGFTVRHFVSKMNGSFGKFEGTIALDQQKIENSSVEATVDVASVNTNNEKRDNHLRTADFFDTTTHPKMTFKSTGFKPTDATTGVMMGDLTINGVTKPVEFAYTILGFGPDAWGNERVGIEATTKVNRKDYNVKWDGPVDKVEFVVADEVQINLMIAAVKEKPAEEKKS